MALKLRCKIYQDERGPWLVTHCLAGLDARGNLTVWVKVHMMNDTDSRMIPMSVDEYNALEYRYFEDVGPVPKG